MGNSKITKSVSVAVAGALVLTSSGATMLSQNRKEVKADKQEAIDKITQTIEDSVSFNVDDVDKEETVYVITDAQGNVSKKIVSDTIKNKDKSDKLVDVTDLENIENVKSDAGYSKDSGNQITWDANGEDICYQGTTQKDLPVDVKITYLLDGNEISAKDLAGKSGKVTFKFEYVNNATKEVKVGDEKVTMKVPFTMISGMLLPGDKFSNITVSNGKVLGDGNNNIVVGYAFPGLAEDINVDEIGDTKIDIPDTLEITADAKDFSLLTILTVGSPDLLASVDVDTSSTKKELEDVIDKLVSATDELNDGAGQLKDGTQSLNDNFVTYSDGIKSLTGGVKQIFDGLNKLNGSTGDFSEGIKAASDGTDQIIAGLEGKDGAIAGANALSVGAVDLNKGLVELSKKVGNKKDQTTIVGAVSALSAGADELSKGLGSKKDLKKGNNKTVAGAITQIADGASQLNDGAKTFSQSVGSTDAKEVAKDAAKKTPGTVAGAVKALATGANQLDKGIETLIEGLNDTKDKNGNVVKPGLITGINQIKAGVGSSDKKEIAKDATSGNPTTLTGGIAAIDAGVGQLAQGLEDTVNTLKASIKDNEQKMSQIEGALAYIQQTGVDPATGQTATAQAIETYKTNYAALTGANQALTAVLQGMNDSNMTEGVNNLKAGTDKLAKSSVVLAQGVESLAAGTGTLMDGVAAIKEGSGALNKGLASLDSKMPQLTKGALDIKNGTLALKNGTQALKDKMGDVVEGGKKLSDGASKLNSNMPALSDGVSQLVDGSSKIKDGNKALETGINTLYTGVKKQLKPGLVKLYNGSLTLADGVDKLYEGSKSANEGGIKINDATNKLSDGIDKLNEGATKLEDGVSQIKTDATDKVVDAYNNDITKAFDRIEGTLDAAKGYNIYSMAPEGKKTTVKFVYRTDSIGK